MNEFMSIEILSTFAGLVLAVGILVQFTKSVIKKSLGDEFVRLYAFIIALILTYVFIREGNSIQDLILVLINAVLVTLSTIGGYEIITDPKAKK